MKGILTTLTEGGQVSMPGSLRKQLHLKPGQLLMWEKVSDDECRVRIVRQREGRAVQSMRGCYEAIPNRRHTAANHSGLDKITAQGRARINVTWVVDTCLLLDIGLDDPQFAEKTEHLLTSRSGEGIVICPITFIELAPAFGGDTKPLEEFLFNLGIEYREDWIPQVPMPHGSITFRSDEQSRLSSGPWRMF